MTSGIGWTGYQSVPRKVVEKIVERRFDENGYCTWEKVTETENEIQNPTPYQYPYQYSPIIASTGTMPGGNGMSSGT